MKLYTDHAFHIGKPHVYSGMPAQDYAVSGLCGDGAYAIVSDGCSTGGMTDIGARLVAHAMKEALCTQQQMPELERLQARLPDVPNKWGFSEQDLLATCVGVYVQDPTRVFIQVFGDGAYAIKFKNGDMVLNRYEWDKNAPYYPAYRSDESLDAFRALHRNTLRPVTQHSVWVAESVVRRRESRYPLESGMRGFNGRLTHMWTVWSGWHHNPPEYIAVFTDGVTQVDGMGWEEVVQELLAFKTDQGLFTKRRLMGFVKNAEKRGRGCLDDIAYAVIHIGEKEKDDGGHQSPIDGAT